jgi:hypothetical protein
MSMYEADGTARLHQVNYLEFSWCSIDQDDKPTFAPRRASSTASVNSELSKENRRIPIRKLLNPIVSSDIVGHSTA